MIVVADTSPLNYLVLIGRADVLPKLFGEVHCPPEVIAELLHPRTPEIVRQWAQLPPEWLKVMRPTGIIMPAEKLGAGETHAITLAEELHARWLLIDERDGRRVAAQHGIHVIGTLAVLELAASRRLVHLPDVLRQLQQTTFRLSLPLVRAALERDEARRWDETKP